MDVEEPKEPKGTVDPEVRAYVYSLVSALGGTGADEDGRYILGDDALACLKDLKKWLKLHDEKFNRLDVARCLAEANLVKGDLLEILAAWPETATEDKLKSKIALACLEVLVPLTWPIEKIDMQMTVNHHRHVPYLQLAQVSYKRDILEHESTNILRTAVRTGLPSIALPIGERSNRDEGIIKLLLYFFRNIAMIAAPLSLPDEGQASHISRSATIEAFQRQDVLALLLTISSNIGEDFDTQDTAILELLFHLLKGVDVEKLFMDRKQLRDQTGDELKSLLAKEAGMHRGYARNAPTRHNRFGTMIWVKRDENGRHSTVSGQDVLKDGQQTLTKMDQTKKWNKTRHRNKDDDFAHDRFDLPVPLTESAKLNLRSFVEEFLDSSFNPLFNHIRKAIARDADRVLEAHKQQFFYLVSWFLEAERVRRREKKQADQKKKDARLDEVMEADSFALVASVLNQETFILLNGFMQDHLDHKAWREVQAGMRCFTQTLLIVQDMSESPIEEDQEIAENIQNRIFYEEMTHDRIISILRGYKDQGFGYLDSCTELSHVFLRMLERYSRENVDMQVRSKRRARKSKKAAAKQRGDTNEDDEDQASESEDIREAERVSKERKFEFTRFSVKFMTQACIDTFVAFTKYYTDLHAEQLKRAHRYFYRVAFKQDLSVMLFRIDIIALFNKMIKGPGNLDPKTPAYKEWDDLVRQLLRKLFKKLDQRPELAVELLFSKINSTTYYLEYGHEKQTISSRPRPPATLEVRGSMTVEEQIGVAVAVLHDEHMDYVDWVSKTLSGAADERQSWEAEAAAREDSDQPERTNDKPEQETLVEQQPVETSDQIVVPSKAPSIVAAASCEPVRLAMFKDAKLRLLMTLTGFERLGIDDEPGATWIIPSSLTSSNLRHSHDVIEKHRRDPVFQYGDDDPLSAEELLRRKPTEKARRVEYDDESEDNGIVSDGEEESFLFPAGGPTNSAHLRQNALDFLKKKRRKRQSKTDSHENGLDDEDLDARRRAKLEADLEKGRKIKSEEFVRDEDEESDEERDRDFFAKEEARRLGQKSKVAEALAAGRVVGKMEGEKVKPTSSATKRKDSTKDHAPRKKARTSSEVSEDDESGDGKGNLDIDRDSPLVAKSTTSKSSDDSGESEEETPMSSPPLVANEKRKPPGPSPEQTPVSSQGEGEGQISKLVLGEQHGEEDADMDEETVSTARRRPRAVVVFDDSDED